VIVEGPVGTRPANGENVNISNFGYEPANGGVDTQLNALPVPPLSAYTVILLEYLFIESVFNKYLLLNFLIFII
jgi:hypothetical protein